MAKESVKARQRKRERMVAQYAEKRAALKAAGDWEILKVNELDDECFATPAIADGRIYIRTRSALYCFGV